MDKSRKKPPAPAQRDPSSSDAAAEDQRRRIGKIVHDERGNASVNWHDAPSNYRRTKFELAEQPGALSVKPPQTFNPYERSTVGAAKPATAPRKDLRKLSEWIKQMRELEERKRKEDEEG